MVPVYEGWKYPGVKVDPPTERYLKLLSSPQTTSFEKASVAFSHLPPGGSTGIHTHPGSDEIMYFVGRGEGMIGGEKVTIETDSVMVAPMGIEHGCWNTSNSDTLKLFCVFIPPLEPAGAFAELVEKTKEYLKGK